MRPLLALLCLATPALAESPRAALFPTDATCYLRHYTDAHLASHPDQLVREIAIGPEPGSFEADVLVLRVAVWLRGTSGRMMAYGYCENTGGALSCGLEGDAGWLMVEPTAKGARVTVGRDGMALEGDSGFVTLGGGHSDDAVFALPRVPADSCP